MIFLLLDLILLMIQTLSIEAVGYFFSRQITPPQSYWLTKSAQCLWKTVRTEDNLDVSAVCGEDYTEV